MDIIYDFSDKLGKYLSQFADEEKLHGKLTKKDIEQILIFWVENLMFAIVWLVPLFAIAHFLNIKFLVAVFILIFLPIRKTFGGWHAPNDLTCTVVSIIFPIGISILATNLVVPLYFIIFAYLFALCSVFYKGIVENPKEPISDERKAKLWLIGIIFLLFIFITHIMIIISNKILISNTMTLAILLGFLNLYLVRTRRTRR